MFGPGPKRYQQPRLGFTFTATTAAISLIQEKNIRNYMQATLDSKKSTNGGIKWYKWYGEA